MTGAARAAAKPTKRQCCWGAIALMSAIGGCGSDTSSTSHSGTDTGGATGIGGSGAGTHGPGAGGNAAGAVNDGGGAGGAGGGSAGSTGGNGGFAGTGSADAGCARFAPVPPNTNSGELSGRIDGLIPLPKSLQVGNGAFPLSPGTPIFIPGPTSDAIARVAGHLRALLERSTGYPIPIAYSGDEPCFPGAPSIVLALAPDPMPEESYRLEVRPDRIELRGRTAAGVSRGVETLRQLFAPQIESPVPVPKARWWVPALTIEDAPRFSYRGLHLDVSRHFFPAEFVKKYIDLAARYKLNVFHWHLTDDHGWRVEIKKYPKLTTVGAWRDESGQTYGGFYTQDEIRDVLAYAEQRFVTVVPEIEMPGHALAALAAYPEYACTPGPFKIPTTWGIFDDIYCPSEATFAFLTDVLAEVFALFPSRYIHLGGDEVRKKRWEQSPVAQAVIQREGLADEVALQGYFMRRMEGPAIQNGRAIVGWDEILETGVSSSATIMAWRGAARGEAAAKQGHDVVMSPSSHYYFDYYQADPATEPRAQSWNRTAGPKVITVQMVYEFNPLPPGLDAAAAAHVLGGQGNLWTEYVPTSDHAEYMAFPRAAALAEALWSEPSASDYAAFRGRLSVNVAHLDVLGVNYAKHALR
jgi:hexosaminidase